MRAEIHNSNERPSTRPSAALTLREFNGKTLDPPLPVYLPWNLTAQEFTQILDSPSDKPAFKFPALRNWLLGLFRTLDAQKDESHPFHRQPYRLEELTIESVDWFDKKNYTRLGYMKIQSEIRNGSGDGDWIPGSAFLRGGSVAILAIVQPTDASGEAEKHVILTVQPRLAVSSLAFTEIPAGMLDDSGSFTGTAAQELKEEAHLHVKIAELLDLSELALEQGQADSLTPTGQLRTAMYPSPGGCDEFMKLYLYQKRLSRAHMEWLKDRATGLENEGERIRLKLVPLEKFWREAARDGKALSALALYENLKRHGRIPDMPKKPAEEPKM
ncbi:hypothetical protein COCSADRAFT_37531 [Bipolaris sorokiniana ND90Pr]|uniref:Nudix hydrolase domain-containing protein n=1 Tax=Cochliobolus sativus (strain ND90Pr / ATCC 201652) TaxID=665912 RepID=M2RA68_COCSN|nr:uncharacterized protein COCSADRAFT_37531 [Bipolaris sorokiniana ND90Pr]EMD63774.1 hypothetical protein COCSADRAFT_37531 [Bipolaris sorokiniana ND90Pr]